ncbi:MAG: hypothetical protein ABL876_03010 [Chitinophagaceae bacterium]
MKKIVTSAVITLLAITAFAQTETFDLATYTPIKGWKKQSTPGTVQFSKEDDTKGIYCMISLLKAVPGTSNSKANFDAAWETVVKEMVTVSAAPEMQPSGSEDGWEAQTGYSPFESDGVKGIVMLVTTSGYEKMVNIIIMTNTDVYEKEISAFLGSISLKKPQEIASKPVTNPAKPAVTNTVAKKDGFAFTTTNFDDGWTSTVQEDWVLVTKGNMKVLLHYPKQGTIFPADPEPLTTAAWNILVAPRYSNLKNYKTTSINNYDRPYIGFGTATDNATGKEVYIVLFRQGRTGWLEFIAPDKNTFMQYFKADPDAIRWDSEPAVLNTMALMVNYNKFGIAASDFKGNWTSDFSGMQQLYHVYTGDYAGMNISQSSETFKFGTGNTYNWNILVVNGMVGSTKYANAKSAGRFTVLNNWQISFTNIEGKPKKYNAFFSCIKGARLLKMIDADHPGSGMYTIYGKE